MEGPGPPERGGLFCILLFTFSSCMINNWTGTGKKSRPCLIRVILAQEHKELVQKGYNGSLSSVHRYLRELKENDKTAKLATTRVETGPGEQMQYDWKEWLLPVDGKLIKIYIHEVVLSCSRMKYYAFSLSITTADVIRALTEAFVFFGGYAPELVMDKWQADGYHPPEGRYCPLQ